MLLLIFIVVIGVSYLFYRYNAVSNKALFFKSPFFISTAGSLGIILFITLVVNLFCEYAYDVPDTIGKTETFKPDTAYRSLIQRDPAYHYRQISHITKEYIYVNYLEGAKNLYTRLANNSDRHLRSLGCFGLGVWALKEDHYDTALTYLKAAPDQTLPWLHFCKAEAFLGKKKFKEEEAELRKEVLVPNGNVDKALDMLIERYKKERNFKALKELLTLKPSANLFPNALARITVLVHGNLGEYLYWLAVDIKNRTTPTGLIAALAIAAAWFYYLFRLNIFKTVPLLTLLAMFVGGMLSVVAVSLFGDIKLLYSSLALHNEFFHDLLYSIFIIGIPEELSKIIPMLLLLLFTKRLKEPIDYVIFASASSLGFSFIENLLYFQEATHGIIQGRAYFSVVGHMEDSSIVAYGLILARFHHTKIKGYLLIPGFFIMAAFTHGIYDFLLFQDLDLLFYMYFVFMTQVWIIMINNSLNNSPRFSYALTYKTEHSNTFITLALTSILALEYILVGFTEGSYQANHGFMNNAAFAGLLIIFFSSNLSNFNLIKGYWRDVYFSSREKKGYGNISRSKLLTGWYFVNAVQAHNYVGRRILVYNDIYNHALDEVMDGEYEGVILDRIILKEDDDEDPNWFIVKLNDAIPFSSASNKYFLVKLRNQNNSLLYEDEVQVFFKTIPSMLAFNGGERSKDQFPFYGWAFIALATTDQK